MITKTSIAMLLALALIFTACSSAGGGDDLKGHFTSSAVKMAAITKTMVDAKTAPDAITALKEGGKVMLAINAEQAPLRKKYPKVRKLMKDNKELKAAYDSWRMASRSLSTAARALRDQYKEDTDVQAAYKEFTTGRYKRDGRRDRRRNR